MWPVTLRELRAESRRRFTYWLRVIGAAAILAAVVFTIQQGDRAGFGTSSAFQSQQIMGRLLFGNVNAALFALIWLIVPLLTADCINREKREGTLGLLFLTPLTAQGIVVGKSFAHGLRALTFVLTMLPILAVPLLMGGVDQKDLLMAVLLDLSALLLALGAGLIASSWTKRWMSALLLAETLSFLFALGMMHIHFICFQSIVKSASLGAAGGFRRAGRGAVSGWTSYSPLYHHDRGFFETVVQLFYFNTAADVEMNPIWMSSNFTPRATFASTWSGVWTSGSAATVSKWFWVAGLIFAGAWLFFGIAIALAAWRIRRSWRLQTQTAYAARLENRFCEPRYWPAVFRKRMNRSLERNPIGWLQQYSVAARLTKWGWCLFVVVVECLFTLNLNDVSFGQTVVFAVLLLAMTFTAAGSFRRERETGALELLLVTPLRVWQIVAGRVGGIWRQFLPATLLALAAALYVSTFDGSFFDHSQVEEMTIGLPLLLSSFLTIPVVGLYWSIRCANFLLAWIGVSLTALVVPWCLTWAWSVTSSHENFFSGALVFLCVQIGLAAVAAVRLIANLTARRFVIPS
jgi:ABC-type transport system involved in multi-copper enzyme maturation permease subunit